MESFIQYYDDLKEIIFTTAENNPKILSYTELQMCKGYISGFSDENILQKFINTCFEHHETILLRKSTDTVVELIGKKEVFDLYEISSEETKEEFWDCLHGMMKSSIYYIHEKREHDGKKYTKSFFPKISISKMKSIWEIDL